MKKGRKPVIVITPEFLEEVEKLAGRGLTQIQIAAYYGVSNTSWHKAKRQNNELECAVKRGKSKTINEVAGILMDHIRAGSLPAAMFYLKTQAGWNEKSTVEVKSKLKSKKLKYKIDSMDAIEASKIYQSIMTGSYNDERNRTSK